MLSASGTSWYWEFQIDCQQQLFVESHKVIICIFIVVTPIGKLFVGKCQKCNCIEMQLYSGQIIVWFKTIWRLFDHSLFPTLWQKISQNHCASCSMFFFQFSPFLTFWFPKITKTANGQWKLSLDTYYALFLTTKSKKWQSHLLYCAISNFTLRIGFDKNKGWLKIIYRTKNNWTEFLTLSSYRFQTDSCWVSSPSPFANWFSPSGLANSISMVGCFDCNPELHESMVGEFWADDLGAECRNCLILVNFAIRDW